MKTAKQIRSEFIDFFKGKDHEFVPSSPIVPRDDDTLLFANAGMNQFKDIFLGLAPAQHARVANSQKCLRVSGKHNDLEEVGKDTYHHTFFEMLGNWSFDDYFKAEAIQWAWELITNVWGIDPDRLWATVFAGDKADGLPPDKEAAELWPKVTPLPAERVLACGKKDNFWEMGDTGPCGPCSELHIDLGPDRCDMKDVPGHECRVNAGCARYIELWNLVFIQFNRQPEKLVPLKARYVDTGAGLERVVAVLQNKESNYDTDLFMPIINATADLSGIRRILRRASRFGRELGMHEPFIYKLVPVVVDCLGDAFGEIRQRADYVSTVIESEEASFGRTLDRGLEIFSAAAERAEKSGASVISGEDAFQLYDTYGFPLDLTELMAQERSLKVDKTSFEELMEQQRERARAASAKDSQSIMDKVSGQVLPETEDLHKYQADQCEGKLVGVIDNDGFRNEGRVETGAEVGLVLDKTCFYAEAGGQIGDCGVIRTDSARFVVENTAKVANCIIHQGKVIEGGFDVGDAVEAIVSKDRNATKKNHTATHLLQWALQGVLGDSVSQQGSYVGPDYLRFDFTYHKAPDTEQLKEVERLVRERIAEDLPVTWTVMPIEEAKKLGAMALFGEKYGDEVRVVGVGARDKDHINEAFSREFCGGTHVDRLGAIGGFKIVREESISAGVRRITALTGLPLMDYLENARDVVDALSTMLKVPDEAVLERVGKLIEDNKKLSKELKTAGRKSGSDAMAEARKLLDKCEKIGETSIIAHQFSAVSVEQAREAIDMLKKKAKSAAVVFGFEDAGKATLLVGVTDDLIKKGLKAGNLVKEIAPIVDGGGGGRPQMAQAGGKNPAKITAALAKIVLRRADSEKS